MQLSDVCAGALIDICQSDFPARFPRDLAEDGQLLIHLTGWLDSHNSGWGRNASKRPRVRSLTHKRTDLSGRFDWKLLVVFFAVFLCTQKTPCEINARQRKHLETAHSFSGTLNCGEASGRWKLLFYFVRCFPFSPSKPL